MGLALWKCLIILILYFERFELTVLVEICKSLSIDSVQNSILIPVFLKYPQLLPSSRVCVCPKLPYIQTWEQSCFKAILAIASESKHLGRSYLFPEEQLMLISGITGTKMMWMGK